MDTEIMILKVNTYSANRLGGVYGGEAARWYKHERVWNCDMPRRRGRLKLALSCMLGLAARTGAKPSSARTR